MGCTKRGQFEECPKRILNRKILHGRAKALSCALGIQKREKNKYACAWGGGGDFPQAYKEVVFFLSFTISPERSVPLGFLLKVTRGPSPRFDSRMIG